VLSMVPAAGTETPADATVQLVVGRLAEGASNNGDNE
jgi:hypothetical protein